jgi:hypothetical protein
MLPFFNRGGSIYNQLEKWFLKQAASRNAVIEPSLAKHLLIRSIIYMYHISPQENKISWRQAKNPQGNHENHQAN